MPKTTRGSMALLITLGLFTLLGGTMWTAYDEKAEATDHNETNQKLALNELPTEGLTFDTTAKINSGGGDTTEGASVSPTPSVANSQIAVEETRGTEAEREQIEAYMKTIFGSEWRVARAVQYNECNPNNPKYPRNCRLTTSVEDSIGIFQINLKSSTTKVHWDRVPGQTHEEKVAWLNDPYNNILMAYWIYSKSGWNPWSAYTSGRYLKDL